ncbi:hypothetical protein MASR2M48_20080 [Spirochaetota bacterium]
MLSNPRIEIRFDSVVEEIKGTKSVESVTIRNLKTDESYDEPCAAVFIFVGSIPQTGALPSGIKMDESGSIMTDERMETNLPGLFAAGDVRVTPFRQIITAVSDGAIAAHCAAQYIDEIEGQAYL